MLIEYTGRQVIVTKAHRLLGDEGVERIRKVLGKTTKVHIILTAEKYRQIAEVTVKTRLHTLVGCAESNTSMDTALREALHRTESQAVKHKAKLRERKRLPKEEKHHEDSELARSRRPGRSAAAVDGVPSTAAAKTPANGRGPAKAVLPVTVHSFPAKLPVSEPHVVRSLDSVALRPMTLEEAVKEAEFRDREVFVFRDPAGALMVLHRKRDGKMELIEAP